MHLRVAPLLLSWLVPTLSYAVSKNPRPLVIWHGLGDSYSSPGMLELQSLIEDIYPGIFIHSVYIDEDLNKDRHASFYGNVDEQVELAAAQLRNISELQQGFDAIGFSQGGQFLRAYHERHAHEGPAIHNLITFGSQHMGISDIPLCRPGDWLCQLARRAARAGVYSDFAQNNLIQAQYFRNPKNLETYLEKNKFLTSINNERPDERNATYARNLANLNKLVLVLFKKDKTVVPKETAWFGSEAPPEELLGEGEQVVLAEPTKIIPMRLQPLYTEDWIGLRSLDKRKAVVLETCEGEHMQIEGCWQGLVKRFVGGTIPGSSRSSST